MELIIMNRTDIPVKYKKNTAVSDLVKIAFFAVLIAVCTWISIPSQIPFTLQTLAIFTALGILGGKKGTIAIGIYILLGLIGIPVFSNFRGGIGVLAGATGGYIMGFIFTGLLYWAITAVLYRFCRTKRAEIIVSAIAMVLGNIVCYAAGTAYFIIIYAKSSGGIGVGAALSMCVLPFVIPDLIKIGVALFISKASGLSRRFGADRSSRRQGQ